MTPIIKDTESIEKSSLSLDRIRTLALDLKNRVDLVKDTSNFKKKLELLAESCYLVAGLQVLSNIKKLDSVIAHERNMGRVTPEVEEWLSQVKKRLSNGEQSTSNPSLKP